MLFKEIVVVYSKNRIEPINTLCKHNAELLIVKAGDIFSYHWDVNGYHVHCNQ
jgi:hypothetical protein